MVASGPLQLQALGLRLKVLGAGGLGGAADFGGGFGAGKTLRAQLLAGIRIAAKPLVEEARQAARDKLPKHGGLNESVASSQIRVATCLTGPRVGVRITNRSHGGRGANKGVISHPVFGNQKVWVKQSDPGGVGWFDQTLAAGHTEVTAHVVSALEIVAAEAMRRL